MSYKPTGQPTGRPPVWQPDPHMQVEDNYSENSFGGSSQVLSSLDWAEPQAVAAMKIEICPLCGKECADYRALRSHLWCDDYETGEEGCALRHSVQRNKP